MDREAWWTTVLGVSKESETTKQLKQQPYSRFSTLSLWVLYMPPPPYSFLLFPSRCSPSLREGPFPRAQLNI